MPVNKLLIISNGHGEDSIAAEIVRRLPKTIEVNAYPTLGDGRAYEGVCPIVGPRRHLPSEGHRLRGSLIRDALAGFGIGPAVGFTVAKLFAITCGAVLYLTDRYRWVAILTVVYVVFAVVPWVGLLAGTV